MNPVFYIPVIIRDTKKLKKFIKRIENDNPIVKIVLDDNPEELSYYTRIGLKLDYEYIKKQYGK
ncbi:MAG: hypothetical protein PHH73_00195 [Candidatus Rickettsiella isopodorum]|nr:hypothetical protein [Candidatus Rickettsiella isopodorum]